MTGRAGHDPFLGTVPLPLVSRMLQGFRDQHEMPAGVVGLWHGRGSKSLYVLGSESRLAQLLGYWFIHVWSLIIVNQPYGWLLLIKHMITIIVGYCEWIIVDYWLFLTVLNGSLLVIIAYNFRQLSYFGPGKWGSWNLPRIIKLIQYAWPGFSAHSLELCNSGVSQNMGTPKSCNNNHL